MNHAEFVDARKNGTHKIYVARDKAFQAVNADILPRSYTRAHIFWSWIWGLSVLGFIIGAFFTMGISLLGLLFVTPVLSRSIKTSAADFVIAHAVENPEFYTFAIANGIITIE